MRAAGDLVACARSVHTAVMPSEIRYAKSGDVSIAFTVSGDAPLDLLFVPGFVSHIELQAQMPRRRDVIERLTSFARVINFDKRGTGLSDRGTGLATLEEYVSDARAVMDAVGSERAAILGVSEGGSTALLFAATYPERASAVIVYGAYARVTALPTTRSGCQPEPSSEQGTTCRNDGGRESG